MTENYNKPVALDNKDYILWGDGDPLWGDPREVCTRIFSKHIVWLCRKKAMSASEIARELNVPTLYVEEELEILSKGENGKYGILRKLNGGKYAINFILLDKDEIEKATAICAGHMPAVCDIICEHIETYKNDYLAFPYLNRKIDLNLILWQQVYTIAQAFSDNVARILSKKYFADTEKPERPFTVFGYVDNGKYYGGGWDSVDAENVCGYSQVHLANIYTPDHIKKHFGCGLNVSNEPRIQMALRAVDGLDIAQLSEAEKEHAAKAVECGYLYREGDLLYTKILVNDMKDSDRLFDISNKLAAGCFEAQAQDVAQKLAELIRNAVPEYLHGEWSFVNNLANSPVLNSLIEVLINKKTLTPPDGGIGAEGCWASVAK